MAGRKLIIGIDYTDRYCQACYYSYRHHKPESVPGGTDVMRYLIPSVMFFDIKSRDWVIGNTALRKEEETGISAVRNLMYHIRTGSNVYIQGTEYSPKQLLGIFFGKLLEFIQIRTSIMGIENITIAMDPADENVKLIMEEVFSIIRIPGSKIRLLGYGECFGYYSVSEESLSGMPGALLFDFGYDGFFAKKIRTGVRRGKPVIYVDEFDFSKDFSIDSLASTVLREQMDTKLSNLFMDLNSDSQAGAVFFTGEGFSEQWFVQTINAVSESCRAFKGSNIYVKGACMAGYMLSQGSSADYLIFCKDSTRVSISLRAWDNGRPEEILLSPGAADWYDAGFEGDFILDEERSIVLNIRSCLSFRETPVEIMLSSFPDRPAKTTRVEVSIKYKNVMECVISITDKGFGDFYRSSGAVVTRYINLEEFI